MILNKLPTRFRYPIEHFLTKAYRVVPLTIRYEQVFWQTYNFLQESQWWSRKKLEEYQMQQLSKLLHHAYENVTYYHKVFDERKMKPKDIRKFDDLKKLPCLDKDTFKSHFSEMMAKNVESTHLKTAHTGGSTGKPLQFYLNPSEIEKEWAFTCHQWSRVGYRPGDPMIKLGGASIGSGALTRNNPYSYDYHNNILYLWPILSKENACNYLEIIRSFGAKFLWGYPSVIAAFANLLKKYSLEAPFRLRAILFASELVGEREREITQEVFNCRVFSHYGLTEHVALAAECEHSSFYHFAPQYGRVELDPETNEIIATGFLNYVNPFIRYRTGDVSSLPVLAKCQYCGRNYFPVLRKVEGRIGDSIVTPQGALIPLGFIVDALYSDFKTIKNSQLVQTSVERVILRVELYTENRTNKSDNEVKMLCQNLQSILGEGIHIKVEVVDEIERSKSGKYKWIISNVGAD